MMDNLHFEQKLTEVFNCLLELKEPITDDTCLQRLQDIIKDKYPNERCPGAEVFLETACGKVLTLEPSVTVFALHLAGRELSLKSDLIILGFNIYRAVHEKELYKDCSIGSAYFDSLCELSEAARGYEWIINRNYVCLEQALSSLKESSSLFLHASARKLLQTITTNTFTKHIAVVYHDRHISSDIIRDFVRELNNVYTNKRNFNVYFQNLLKLFSSCEKLLQFLKLEEDVLLKLVQLCLLGQVSLDIEHILVVQLKGLAQWTFRSEPDYIGQFLKKQFIPLCEMGECSSNITRFHKMAVQFHKSFQDKADMTTLEDIIMAPYHVKIAGKPQGLPSQSVMRFERALSHPLHSSLLLTQMVNWMTQQKGHFENLVRVLSHVHKDSNVWTESVHTKLLICVIEAITKKIDVTMSPSSLKEVMDVLLEVTKSPSTHNTVLDKGMETVIECLIVLSGMPECDHFKSYLPLVTSHLERCLVGTQWENRDTAVELVTKLVSKLKAEACAAPVDPCISSVVVSAWRCIEDSDSYVRASAARLVATLVAIPHIWQSFLSDLQQSEDDVTLQLEDIITTDTEAFPRRAAVLSLIEIYTHRPLAEPTTCRIRKTMLKAMSDFDWEVKSNVLDFWQDMLDKHLQQENLPSYAADLLPAGTKRKCDENGTLLTLTDLSKSGFFHALLLGVEDYDQHVCEKAYRMLKHFKAEVGDVDESDLKKFKRENSKDDVLDDASNGDVNESDQTDKLMRSDTDYMWKILSTSDADVDAKLATLSVCGDEYNKNPIALLEDILSEDKDLKEETFVDCY